MTALIGQFEYIRISHKGLCKRGCSPPEWRYAFFGVAIVGINYYLTWNAAYTQGWVYAAFRSREPIFIEHYEIDLTVQIDALFSLGRQLLYFREGDGAVVDAEIVYDAVTVLIAAVAAAQEDCASGFNPLRFIRGN